MLQKRRVFVIHVISALGAVTVPRAFATNFSLPAPVPVKNPPPQLGTTQLPGGHDSKPTPPSVNPARPAPSTPLVYPARFLEENEAAAIAFDFKVSAIDASKKYPLFDIGQRCATCSNFQVQDGETVGMCPTFPNKLIRNQSWCAAYKKKTA